MSEKIGACRDKLCTLIHLLRLPLTSSLPRPFAYSQIKRRFSSHLQRSFPSKYSLTGTFLRSLRSRFHSTIVALFMKSENNGCFDLS